MMPDSRKGLTLIEILVALAISMIVIGGVSFAFISVIRASDEAEAVVRAHASARSAVDAISRDLRALQLDRDEGYQQLILSDRPLAYGDRIDNDSDGSVDEEEFNAVDDDGDWSTADDRHATIGAFQERPLFVGLPDYGDEHIDEDCVFSADELSFIMPAGTSGAKEPRKRVIYKIGSFDGEDHVLLKEVTRDPSFNGVGDTSSVEPVVFDVVSLDVLAWNPNNDQTQSPNINSPYWAKEWNALNICFPATQPFLSPFNGPPPFKLPAAFLIQVTVNAERRSLSEIGTFPLDGKPLRTVTMTTIVNVESVVQNPVYDRYLRN